LSFFTSAALRISPAADAALDFGLQLRRGFVADGFGAGHRSFRDVQHDGSGLAINLQICILIRSSVAGTSTVQP
jgi:hypothetical protein